MHGMKGQRLYILDLVLKVGNFCAKKNGEDSEAASSPLLPVTTKLQLAEDTGGGVRCPLFQLIVRAKKIPYLG